ncbi:MULTISPECIES: hypothetical protein [unclassified Paludibacterium]|uniref:hypothetical protein n=1 Tax=unclassified Paludibacterium TaxID=2618429 RepID=UPI001C05571C|nr:hypothetical protein [Paludibacterium sp. B53371]BEV71164.1 hypothetical protein THUN1379_06460 [Paludibacterium sp. THUN1379]
MLKTTLKNAYDRFYFSRLRNTLTLRRSLVFGLTCLAVALADDWWPGLDHELFAPWVDRLLVFLGLCLILSLIPDLIGFRKSMLNLIPCGQNRWEIRLALIPFLQARRMAKLDTNYLELEVFTILRYAYAQHLTGTVSMASHLFSNRERRAGRAEDIQAYFVGWQANEQENLSQLGQWHAWLINRLIMARNRDDGKDRHLISPGPIHGIVIHCQAETFR